MSDPENFIARWSRRKRAAAERADEETSAEKTSEQRTPPAASDAVDERAAAEDKHAAQTGAPSSELPFDLAKLPPLESITAESDIRAFLAPGVPAELTRAALRRAWSADPKVRDFVGLADYDWDFNAPGAMAGFGPLEMTDELRRQVAQMVGRSLAPEEPERPAATPSAAPAEQASVEAPDQSIESIDSGVATAGAPTQAPPSNTGTSQGEAVRSDVEIHNFLQRETGDAAPQYKTEKSDNVQLIAKRSHGRALPQ
jgi:Protein of unknown function (DUF3306)